MINRLALGTVQFGFSYGIANTNGQVPYKTAKEILYHAKSKGINTLDTAISYGESESYLGDIGVEGWQVITKLPNIPDECTDIVTWVNNQVTKSLSRLKVKSISGLLLHQPDCLLTSNGEMIWESLQTLKKDRLVENIGFSIYDPNELDVIWNSFFPDIVQVPYNVLDRRLVDSGWLHRMSKAGVKVHVRSIFLQGLLLMNANNRPQKFERWFSVFDAWDSWLQEQELTALQGCLAFVMQDSSIDKIVIGIDNFQQFKEVLSSIDNKVIQFPKFLNTDSIDLINPSYWSSL
jgi:aryl-alcohol dehydrogenase-like predicted oxidoreductase